MAFGAAFFGFAFGGSDDDTSDSDDESFEPGLSFDISGSDTLTGTDGNDTFSMIDDTGHVELFGGAGDDVFDLQPGRLGFFPSGVFSGGIGNDTISGSGLTGVVDGGPGHDSIDFDRSITSSTIDAGAGDDFLRIAENSSEPYVVDPGEGDDTVIADGGNGDVFGGLGMTC